MRYFKKLVYNCKQLAIIIPTMADTNNPSPVDTIRRQMRAKGVTVTEWADHRGFSRATTYAVLAGRVKGVRGEAYQIARALGIIEPPPDSECTWLTGEERIDSQSAGE